MALFYYPNLSKNFFILTLPGFPANLCPIEKNLYSKKNLYSPSRRTSCPARTSCPTERTSTCRRDFLSNQSKKKKQKFFCAIRRKLNRAHARIRTRTHARTHTRGGVLYMAQGGGVYGAGVYGICCFLNSTHAHTHARTHAHLPYIIYARTREGAGVYAILLFSKKSRNTIDYKINALYNNGATTRTRI